MYTKNSQVVTDLPVENKFHYCRLWKIFSPVVSLCQVARTQRQLFQNYMDLFVYSEKKNSQLLLVLLHIQVLSLLLAE